MHLKTFLIVVVLPCFIAVQGCYDTFNCERPSGQILTQEIDVPSFRKISFDEAGNVYLRQDSVQSVIVESYGNIIAALNTTVRDDTWNIRFHNCFRQNDKFDVYISLPELNSVVLSGSGNIIGDGPFDTDDFSVALLGSGNISIDINCETLDADISGSGNISLGGQTNNEMAFISGSGNILAFDLESNTCEVRISGSGNCDVSVNDELNVTIPGSGTVRYKGNPSIVNSTISGSGSVIQID